VVWIVTVNPVSINLIISSMFGALLFRTAGFHQL